MVMGKQNTNAFQLPGSSLPIVSLFPLPFLPSFMPLFSFSFHTLVVNTTSNISVLAIIALSKFKGDLHRLNSLFKCFQIWNILTSFDYPALFKGRSVSSL